MAAVPKRLSNLITHSLTCSCGINPWPWNCPRPGHRRPAPSIRSTWPATEVTTWLQATLSTNLGRTTARTAAKSATYSHRRSTTPGSKKEATFAKRNSLSTKIQGKKIYVYQKCRHIFGQIQTDACICIEYSGVNLFWVLKLGCPGTTRAISCLLMPWLLHRQVISRYGIPKHPKHTNYFISLYNKEIFLI